MSGPWEAYAPSKAADGPWSQYQPTKKAAASKPSLLTQATGFMANVNRGLGIGDEIAGAVQGAVNYVQGVPNALQEGMRQQRATEDRFQATNPTSAALARGIGNAPTAFVPIAGTSALAARGANALSSAAMAGLSGAAFGAADRGNAKERLAAASASSYNPVSLGLGAIGGALAPAAARAPKVKYSDQVAALRKAGVELTPGQMRGGVAKVTEDAATSFPILGTAIQEARGAGFESFNTAAANQALKPVGLRVPKNVAPGNDTVAFVEKQLGRMYDQATPNGPTVFDDQARAGISTRLSELTADMTEEGAARLDDILARRVKARLTPLNDNGAGDPSVALDPARFRRVITELNTVKARFGSSQDPDQRAIEEGISIVQEELRAAAARQDPRFAAQKARVDKGWALFKRMQGAAASPGAESGVFSPAQYGGAVRRADRSLDKGATARGGALGQDFANAGRAVLPSKVPDSGTATRGALLATGAAGLKVGGALLSGNPATAIPTMVGGAAALGGLKLASRAYSPEAIALANKALDKRIAGQEAATALRELGQMAMQDVRVQELYRKVAAAVATGGGVATASAVAAGEPPER